ncbi:MAG TPA: hypothetical protein VF731_04675 [Solirubrobacterales bacterium]
MSAPRARKSTYLSGLLILVVAALALAISGCGGSGSNAAEVGHNLKASDFRQPPQPQFSRAALRKWTEPICRRITKEFSALKGPPANVGAMKAVDYMARYGLEQLHTRAGVTADFEAFLHALKHRDRMLAGLYTKLPLQEHREYARKYRIAEAKTTAAARRLGLRDCPYH